MGPLDLLYLLVGAAVGVGLGVFIARQQARLEVEKARSEGLTRAGSAEATAEAERATRARAEAELEVGRARVQELAAAFAGATERLTATQKALEDQKVFLADAKRDMESVFKASAADALRGNHAQFLAMASERLETTQKPLRETLEKLEKKTGEIESARVAAYAKIDEQVRALSLATESATKGANTLATALKSNHVRGRWGEMALKNVVELAGMTEHCDFEEQSTTDDGSRPDLTVKLPGGRLIAVDSKAPMDAYFKAADPAVPEGERERALGQHAAALRAHVIALSRRDYAKSLGAGVDIVVLFLPGDALLSAAFARDPDLQTDALRMRVLVATPVTLVALLRTVAIYHEQESIARNAEEIAACARELYDRGAKFGEDFAGVGKGLQSALRSFNAAVASFETRFLPMARRLDELKAVEQTKRTLVAPVPIDEVPRELKNGAPPSAPPAPTPPPS